MIEASGDTAKLQARRVFVVACFLLLSAAMWMPDLRRAFGHPL